MPDVSHSLTKNTHLTQEEAWLLLHLRWSGGSAFTAGPAASSGKGAPEGWSQLLGSRLSSPKQVNLCPSQDPKHILPPPVLIVMSERFSFIYIRLNAMRPHDYRLFFSFYKRSLLTQETMKIWFKLKTRRKLTYSSALQSWKYCL